MSSVCAPSRRSTRRFCVAARLVCVLGMGRLVLTAADRGVGRGSGYIFFSHPCRVLDSAPLPPLPLLARRFVLHYILFLSVFVPSPFPLWQPRATWALRLGDASSFVPLSQRSPASAVRCSARCVASLVAVLLCVFVVWTWCVFRAAALIDAHHPFHLPTRVREQGIWL